MIKFIKTLVFPKYDKGFKDGDEDSKYAQKAQIVNNVSATLY